MKNNAIVANMGHFPVGEIEVARLADLAGVKRVTIKPQARPKNIFHDVFLLVFLTHSWQTCWLGTEHGLALTFVIAGGPLHLP